MAKQKLAKPRNTLKKQLNDFKINMDGWVKEFSKKQENIAKLQECTCKNCEDIETNLVLIYLQQVQITQLQNEIEKLKVKESVQLV